MVPFRKYLVVPTDISNSSCGIPIDTLVIKYFKDTIRESHRLKVISDQESFAQLVYNTDINEIGDL